MKHKDNLSDFCTSTSGLYDARHALVTNKRCPKCGGELECNTMEILTVNPPKYNCKCRECGYSTSYFCHEINYHYTHTGDFDLDSILNNNFFRPVQPGDLQHEEHHDIINRVLSNGGDVDVTTLPYITPNSTVGSLGGCNHYYDVKVSGGKIITYCVKCGKIGDIRDQLNSFGITCDPCTTVGTFTSTEPHDTTLTASGKSITNEPFTVGTITVNLD